MKMKTKYQCPNCNSKTYVGLGIDSSEYTIFKVYGLKDSFPVGLHIYLNCGAVFVDERGLVNIKKLDK